MRHSVGHSSIRRGQSESKSETKNKRNMKTVNKAMKKTTLEAEERKITQIIDLNDDCLLKIFDLLSITDLVNISLSNSRLTSSARSVFSRKFAKAFITITNETNSAGQLPSVSLLIAFGDLIKQLRVKYKDDYHRFNHDFEVAIIINCGESLDEIIFINSDKFAFIQIEQPFVKVKEATFIGCTLGKFIFEVNKWFPNLRALELFESRILRDTDLKCIEQTFPKLEHLGITNYVYDGRSLFQPIFTNINLKAAINLNPQLRSLRLKHDTNEDLSHVDECGVKITPIFLTYVNEKLPLLDELELMIVGVDLIEQRNIHFRNLRKLTFVFVEAQTLVFYDISTRLPTKVKLTGVRLDDSCSVFLSKNKKWSKIVIHGCWKSNQSYKAFQKSLTNFKQLKSIEMSYNGLKAQQNEILLLLSECKLLRSLNVFFWIVPWHETISQADTYEEDKRATEQKLLDALKLLPNWRASQVDYYYDDDDDDYDNNNDNDDITDESDNEGVESTNQWKRERQADTFLETFRNTFPTKCLVDIWQVDYKKLSNFCCATYEKKNLKEE